MSRNLKVWEPMKQRKLILTEVLTSSPKSCKFGSWAGCLVPCANSGGISGVGTYACLSSIAGIPCSILQCDKNNKFVF